MNGVDLDKTWDMVRSHRNRELSNSDGKVTEDMPDVLKTKWKTYRQQLRDLPAKMQCKCASKRCRHDVPNATRLRYPPTDSADSDGSGTPAWAPPLLIQTYIN